MEGFMSTELSDSEANFMAIKALIWDLGGVIQRTEDYGSRDALAAQWGMTRHEIETFVYGGDPGIKAQSGQVPYDQHWLHLCSLKGWDPSYIPEFQAAFWKGDVTDWELIDFIRSLRPAYKTGLLSNAFSELRRLVTDEWRFADAFDVMVISAEEGIMKPDPQIYQTTLARLGVQPEEAVFIDDMLRNVDGARQVGMQAIHFKNSAQVRQELRALLALAQE
jgi:glucose-1-phosphatase